MTDHENCVHTGLCRFYSQFFEMFITLYDSPSTNHGYGGIIQLSGYGGNSTAQSGIVQLRRGIVHLRRGIVQLEGE